MKIIIDSREQAPYDFAKYDCDLVTDSLTTGDYSLVGLSNLIAVERKSIDDLLGCLTSGRDRFERELQRAKALEAFAVIVECSWFDIGHGNYKSKMKPHAALQSILAFQVRYRVPFMFTGDRAGGEYACYWFLQKYIKEQQKRLKVLSYYV